MERIPEYDYLIIGAGIIGMTIGRELATRFPNKKIGIIEKEAHVAYHASGRNSGVLHAGFYYTADSLKARFTRDGNKELTKYCLDNQLKINQCGKIIVASNEEELVGLYELKRRGDKNGVELQWLNEEQVKEIDPSVRTCKKALFSPNTSTVDPVEVCQTIYQEIRSLGVEVFFKTSYQEQKQGEILTNQGSFTCEYFINAAGLYADRIAKDFQMGKKYTIIPFKGRYLYYSKNKTDVRTNIYPVPNLKNPFLGVHFTVTVDGTIKIGPTAIPALWRENYKGLENFKWNEFLNILYYETKLFIKNSFNFRNLAFEEMKKYYRSNFIELSMKMVDRVDCKGFGGLGKPGIRAQLLDKETDELVSDFVLEGDYRSMHVLNAVSPGFTCSFPFARYVVDEIMKKQTVESIGKPS